VVQRLFFDRVDAKPRAATVGGEQHLAILHGADKASGALSFVQFAFAWTQVALNASVAQLMPPAGRAARQGARQGIVSFHFFT
jgi:hypothetical protein